MSKLSPAPKPRHKAQKKRFHARRDPAYQDWVRERPCLLWIARGHWSSEPRHYCLGVVQVCHVKSRGAGGFDHENIIPLCAGAHDEQGRGIKSFERKWGIKLGTAALALWERYCAEQIGDSFMRAFE